VAKHGACPKKIMFTPCPAPGRREALGEGPALVVAERKQRPVLQENRRVLLHGDVVGVSDVEAMCFHEAQQRYSLLRSRRHRLRWLWPVERDDSRPVAHRVCGRAVAEPLVVVVAAVGVPGLLGVHVPFEQVGRVARGSHTVNRT